MLPDKPGEFNVDILNETYSRAQRSFADALRMIQNSDLSVEDKRYEMERLNAILSRCNTLTAIRLFSIECNRVFLRLQEAAITGIITRFMKLPKTERSRLLRRLVAVMEE